MKRSTLELLCCPDCRGGLSLGGTPSHDMVDEGELNCPSCGHDFPIRNGIARFISQGDLEGQNLGLVRFYRRYSRFESILDKLIFIPLGGERKARMEVLRRLGLKGGRILEVSIGSGCNLPFLFESSEIGEVYGLDISAEQLKRCSELVGTRGWQVDLFQGMAEALPFKADSFDDVLHIGGINFFSDKKRAIDEMVRVARPGGKIVIADESERVAQMFARLLRLSRASRGGKMDTSVPVYLVPDTMEEIRTDGIWKAHGRYHGYVLEFRKPAS
jgi:ubiquinone/menaquinone biosynthesis C-methylase UbiE/uncharacterized protein YbaR (Trm112 family)